MLKNIRRDYQRLNLIYHQPAQVMVATSPTVIHLLAALICTALCGCTSEEVASTEPTCDLEACEAENAGPGGRSCFILVLNKMNLEKKCLEDGVAVACENDIMVNLSNGFDAPGPYLIESPDGECWYSGSAMFPKGWRQLHSENKPTSICEPYLDYYYYEIPRNCSAYPDYVPPKDLTTGGAP